MNNKQTLDNIAERIEYIICNYEAELIPTEDYGWVNRRYSNDKSYDESKIFMQNLKQYSHTKKLNNNFGKANDNFADISRSI